MYGIERDRLVKRLDKGKALHEGQAGFRVGRGCVDNIYMLNELVQGRLKEGKEFFLDVQKAYDSVWRNSLWFSFWEFGVRGKMWRVIKRIYESSESTVLLDGELSEAFDVEQGVAHGCSLSPILFCAKLCMRARLVLGLEGVVLIIFIR